LPEKSVFPKQSWNPEESLTALSKPQYLLGVDVGSTTLKAVVVHTGTDEIVWQRYERHETRQGPKLLEFLENSFRR
jgi:activator of 2-hydroxyglutaryl-CoA dehydratase